MTCMPWFHRTHSRKLQQVSGGPVVVANGEPLHILRQTQSKIHLAGIEFTHNVLVTGDVSQDCLLGADFHECMISHSIQKLLWPETSYSAATTWGLVCQTLTWKAGESLVTLAYWVGANSPRSKAGYRLRVGLQCHFHDFLLGQSYTCSHPLNYLLTCCHCNTNSICECHPLFVWKSGSARLHEGSCRFQASVSPTW